MTGRYVLVGYEPPPDTSACHDATFREIREWVLREYGLKVFSYQVTQVKREHGVVMRGNLSRPLPEGKTPPDVPDDKRSAIEAALRHFGMLR